MGFSNDFKDAWKDNWNQARRGETRYLVGGTNRSSGCALVLLLGLAAIAACTLLI